MTLDMVTSAYSGGRAMMCNEAGRLAGGPASPVAGGRGTGPETCYEKAGSHRIVGRPVAAPRPEPHCGRARQPTMRRCSM
jgi:hypothetical protein